MRTYRLLPVLLLAAGLVSACTHAAGPAPTPGPTQGAAAQVALAPTPAPGAAATSPAGPASVSWPTPLPPAPDPAYWPTDGWRTSMPEEQGMDSNTLAAMIEMIAQQKLDVHGLVVVRHGYVVAEAYFHPYSGDIPHELASATKSFTGALTGIAAGEGKIKGVDEKVLSYFPDRTVANLDPRKDAMTLRDLLTMRTGLDWAEWNVPFTAPYNSVLQMTTSKDWVGYVLDRPMAGAPGQAWNYNSGASHLISAIVGRATGGTEAQYADSRLFGPLGIKERTWSADPQGVTTGYAGLRLRPRDMAKFGFLYLHGGRWEGQQVVPAEWVRATLQRPEAGGTAYGYQMWLDDGGVFTASGMGGQLIWVDPADDLVGAVVSGLAERQSGLPHDLMISYARRAAKSDGPLPPNPAGQARLAAAQRSAASPEPGPVVPVPVDAARNAAHYCIWSPNYYGVLGVSMTFGDGAEATSHMCFEQGCFDFKVGLDGVYRINDFAGQPLAQRGTWEDDGTFLVQAQILWQAGRQDVRTVATEGGNRMTISDSVTGQTQTITCTWK